MNSVSYRRAMDELHAAHSYVVERAIRSMSTLPEHPLRWGASIKRVRIDLSGPGCPPLIGKAEERLVEAINIAATIERMLDALAWFSVHVDFRSLLVLECHPSTSSTTSGNDLVLGLTPASVIALCEVTDVAGSAPGQNNKEKKDLRNLGCTSEVPDDGKRRFICTSTEFANALAGQRRTSRMHYRYERCPVDGTDTIMLEIRGAHLAK